MATHRFWQTYTKKGRKNKKTDLLLGKSVLNGYFFNSVAISGEINDKDC